MKIRFSIVLAFLCLCLSARASSLIKATITITNLPAIGNTLTVNSDARTWQTNVTTAASQILIGADTGISATNLFLQIAANRYAGNVTVAQTATNAITLTGIPGGAMVVSQSGTWATITLTTQTVAVAYAVQVPASSIPTASQATNIISLLVLDIGNYSTNAWPATAAALANFISLTGSQTITGAKLFNSASTFGGNLTNGIIGNESILYATTNNGLMYWASGGSQPSYAIAPDSNGKPSLWSITTDAGFNRILSTLTPYVPSGNNLLTFTVASNKFGALATTNNWLGTNTFAMISGTPIVGGSISGGTTISGTIVLMTGGVISNTALTAVSSTNQTDQGQHTFASDVSFSRSSNTSLANGNNAAVSFGTNAVYIKVKAGPTASFAINGIAGGRDGRELILDNATGQTMTIANDSGVDPTPANRILTRTGSDVSTGTGGVVTLIYDSESSRWILKTFNAGGAGVTSVGLAAPLPFSVSSSPVVGAGTIQLSVSTNGSGNVVLDNGPTMTNIAANGVTKFASGSSSSPAATFSSDTHMGMYYSGFANILGFAVNSLGFYCLDGGNNQMRVAGANAITWSSNSTDPLQSQNAGIAHDGSSEMRVSNGSSNSGGLKFSYVVNAKTGNYSVTNPDSGKLFTNAGASGEVDFTLPTWASGLFYIFDVEAAQTLKVIAAGTDTIRIAGSVSVGGGNITNATIGGMVTIAATASGKWVATSHEGTWTVN